MKISNLALSVLLLSTQVYASTPIWNNFHADAAHTGYLDVQVDPAKIKKLWNQEFVSKASLDGYAYLYPIITDHMLYLMVQTYSHLADPKINGLYAMNPETGKIIWQNNLAYRDSFTTHPLFDNDKLYWLTPYKNYYQITAVNAETGELTLSASIDATDKTKITTSVVYDHHLYLADSNGYQYSVDGNTGAVDWLVPAGDDQGYPTVSENYVFRHHFPGIDVMNRRTGESFFIPVNESEKYTASTPLWDEKTKTLFEVTHAFGADDELIAVDVEHRLVKWRTPFKAYTNTPVLAGDKIYLCDLKKVYEVNAATGEINWSADSMDGNGDMLVTPDMIFITGFGTEKTIAISRQTHQIVWSYNQSGALALDKKRLYLMTGAESTDGVQLIAFSVN